MSNYTKSRYTGCMKTIALPTGESVLVDDEDYEHLRRLAWALHKSPSHPIGYAQAQESGSRKHHYMHRMVMAHHGFDIAGKLVDHRSLDTLDNQKGNLRIATHSESQWNKRIYRNNRTGFKGVSKPRDRTGWYVQINKHKKSFFRGTFSSLTDAAQVSVLMRFLAHGEFGRTA